MQLSGVQASSYLDVICLVHSILGNKDMSPYLPIALFSILFHIWYTKKKSVIQISVPA
jgi:hypothetical protein